MQEKLELIRKGKRENKFETSEFGVGFRHLIDQAVFQLTEDDYVDIVKDLEKEMSDWETQIAGMEKERMDLLRDQMENELRSTPSST